MKRASILACLAALALVPVRPLFAADLIVHEWGTFTSFQDADGHTIAGINVDDEPVPGFVHRLADMPIFTLRSLPARWSQGAPSCHPEVTLRLETPVLYFYPQSGFDRNQSIAVNASFVGGWLTEFYPFAKAGTGAFPKTLESSTRGSLDWDGLRLPKEPTERLPATKARVWLAPRNVASAVVVGRDQEAEKYLFYRGVGHIDAPFVIREQGGRLSIEPRKGQRIDEQLPMWLVRVMPDRRVLYRSVALTDDASSTPTPEDNGAGNRIEALRGEIAVALKAQGLYEDEAKAMLETWRLSYFESEGVRLFFVLPRSWTDAHLPLSISTPADVTRVMLGRIELVSAHQRTVLEQLLKLPESAFDIRPPYFDSPEVQESMAQGRGSHAEYYRMMGKPVPEALTLYDSLGRFRDALLAHELRATQDQLRKARLASIMQRFGACELSGG